MLIPNQDKINQKLMFICRTCKHNQEAESACIHRNELSNTVGETAGITQDVGSDPTVGLVSLCTMCGQEIVCRSCGEPTLEDILCLEIDQMALTEDNNDEEQKNSSVA